jgi:WD40 repeat protein
MTRKFQLLSIISIILLLQTISVHSQSGDIIYEVTWDKTGSYIAIGRESGIVDILAASNGQIMNSFQSTELGPAATLSWSQNNLLAVGSNENFVRVWDLNSQALAFITPAHDQGGVQSVEWSPDGQKIASATYFGSNAIQIYDRQTDAVIFSKAGDSVYSISWSPDGTQIVIVSGIRIEIIEVITGEVITELRGIQEDLQQAKWNHSGNLLAASDLFGYIQVFDIVEQSQRFLLEGHQNRVGTLDWHPLLNYILRIM